MVAGAFVAGCEVGSDFLCPALRVMVMGAIGSVPTVSFAVPFALFLGGRGDYVFAGGDVGEDRGTGGVGFAGGDRFWRGFAFQLGRGDLTVTPSTGLPDASTTLTVTEPAAAGWEVAVSSARTVIAVIPASRPRTTVVTMTRVKRMWVPFMWSDKLKYINFAKLSK